jgi:hypothetical protein
MRLSGTPVEVSCPPTGGLFAESTGTLSTTLDEDPLTFTFAEPVPGFAIEGGIIGEIFPYPDVWVELAAGDDSSASDVAATGAASPGIVSETPFAGAPASRSFSSIPTLRASAALASRASPPCWCLPQHRSSPPSSPASPHGRGAVGSTLLHIAVCSHRRLLVGG